MMQEEFASMVALPSKNTSLLRSRAMNVRGSSRGRRRGTPPKTSGAGTEMLFQSLLGQSFGW